MAELMKYTYDHCGFSAESWSDGDSYIQFPDGKRQYFYHPAENIVYGYIKEFLGREPNLEEMKSLREEYAGHEVEYVCTNCHTSTLLDSSRDPITCKNCKSRQILEVYMLKKTQCFKCNQGHFDEGDMIGLS